MSVSGLKDCFDIVRLGFIRSYQGFTTSLTRGVSHTVGQGLNMRSSGDSGDKARQQSATRLDVLNAGSYLGRIPSSQDLIVKFENAL